MSQYCNRCGRPHDKGECLREKIAAAIISNPDSADEYAIADDVINALGLHREYEYGTNYPTIPTSDFRYVRYVTEWARDENQ